MQKNVLYLFVRVPLQQMLDVNDVIWYCSEIRHQIEKKHYHLGEEHHPLLKYVRSSSFPRRAPQPTTTASNYSFSNVMSTVINPLLTARRPSPSPIFNLQQQFEMECIEMIERFEKRFHLWKMCENCILVRRSNVFWAR